MQPLLLPLGFLAGVLAGLLGIGGGVLFVPLFLWVLGAGAATAHYAPTALGTSKAVILVCALAAARVQLRADRVDVNLVIRLAPALALGAVAGGTAATLMPAIGLKRAFGCFLLVIVGLMLVPRRQSAQTADRRPRLGDRDVSALALAIGGVASFLGIGGGLMIVPLLHVGLERPAHEAMATSSALMIVTAAVGTLTYVSMGLVQGNPMPHTLGFVDLLAWVFAAPGAVLGAHLGVRLARSVSAHSLQTLFATLLAVLAFRMVWAG